MKEVAVIVASSEKVQVVEPSVVTHASACFEGISEALDKVIAEPYVEATVEPYAEATVEPYVEAAVEPYAGVTVVH